MSDPVEINMRGFALSLRKDEATVVVDEGNWRVKELKVQCKLRLVEAWMESDGFS